MLVEAWSPGNNQPIGDWSLPVPGPETIVCGVASGCSVNTLYWSFAVRSSWETTRPLPLTSDEYSLLLRSSQVVTS